MTDWLRCKWGFGFCFTNREETEGILLFVCFRAELQIGTEAKPLHPKQALPLTFHFSGFGFLGEAVVARHCGYTDLAFEDPRLQLIEWLWVICWLTVINLTKTRARVTYGRKTLCSGLPKTKFSTQTRFMCPRDRG